MTEQEKKVYTFLSVYNDTCRLNVKGQKKKIFHANSNYKRAGLAILISDKLSLSKKQSHTQNGHYDEMINLQGDKIIINTYVSTIR